MSYVDSIIDQVKQKDADQPEFIQAVTEVLTSLEPVINANPAYEKASLLERIVEPERVVMFRVPWVDDEGKGPAGRSCSRLRFGGRGHYGFGARTDGQIGRYGQACAGV